MGTLQPAAVPGTAPAKTGMELRRYFYPALNTLKYLGGNPCPIAEDKAERVICLPLFHDLGEEDQDRVIEFLKRS